MTIVDYNQFVPDQIIPDVSQLTISGYVQREPEMHEEPGEPSVCTFVLTHAREHEESGHRELQLYNVAIYGPLGQFFASTHQPGQKVVIRLSTPRPSHPTAKTPSSNSSYPEHRERPAATITGRSPNLAARPGLVTTSFTSSRANERTS